jgi:acyl-CoA hydrolase
VRLVPDLGDRDVLARIESECLREHLKGGVVASAGFFLGPGAFYQALRDMPEDERALINMTSVLKVNHLYDDVELDTLQRREARFINSCLMATLTGAVVSDGLENQRVLSGVGGQSDFVNMAHALPDGRSIITLRSTRESGGRTTSNIRFSYGHTTLPRHLRDFVITEYGIADLRGKSDSEVAAAMLNITDSRFQERLLAKARKAGKLPSGYRIPDRFRNNYPETLEKRLSGARSEGLCTAFPFGSDLTKTEQRLSGALKRLSARMQTTFGKMQAAKAAFSSRPVLYPDELKRLGLDSPADWKERIYARLVAGELGRDA